MARLGIVASLSCLHSMAATADGVDQIRIPGEMAEHVRQQRLQEGVPIEPVVWQEICNVAEKVGVVVPEVD